MLTVIAVLAGTFMAGFGCGFVVRASISRKRRTKARRAAGLL